MEEIAVDVHVEEIAVDVLLDPEARARLAEVVQRLTLAGLREPAVLPGLGVVRGRIDEARIDAVSAVAGVRAVERARPVHATGRRA